VELLALAKKRSLKGEFVVLVEPQGINIEH
jgi:hypothetical protein